MDVTSGSGGRRLRQLWRSPLTWLALIQLVAAYEWLVSGLNKILAGNFPQALRGIIVDAMRGNPNGWDVNFLRGAVLPCCATWGGMIECGEVFVGLALASAVALWALGERLPARIRRFGSQVSAVAALGAAFMNLNFYVAMGGTFPGLSAANAANEGVSIDVVLMLIMLALAAANLALAPASANRGAPVAPTFIRLHA